MGRCVDLRDQIDPSCVRHGFQVPIVVLCVDRVAIHFVEIFKPLACVGAVFRETRESIALQTVHAVPLRAAGKSCRTVGKIIIQMELELIHLVPGQNLRIVLKILKPVRDPSHIKHHAADLIIRIITDHAAWDIVIAFILPQDLLRGDRPVKRPCISAAVNAHTVLVHGHEVSFLTSVIDILCLRLDINIRSRRIAGFSGYNCRLYARKLCQILLHIFRDRLQIHARRVIDDDP